MLVGRPARRTPTGNQLLSALFGAQLHFTGRRGEPLGRARDRPRIAHRRARRRRARPVRDPDRRQHRRGRARLRGGVRRAARPVRRALGRAVGDRVHVVERRHARRAARRPGAVARARSTPCPTCSRSASPRASTVGRRPTSPSSPTTRSALIGPRRDRRRAATCEVDTDWIGDDYAVPTAAGDAAIRWAARHGGWLLDRTYSRQGLRRACSASPTRHGWPTETTSCSSTPAVARAVRARRRTGRRRACRHRRGDGPTAEMLASTS